MFLYYIKTIKNFFISAKFFSITKNKRLSNFLESLLKLLKTNKCIFIVIIQFHRNVN